MRLTEFAAAMGSRVENLDEDFEIRGISTLDRAVPGEISFISNEKYLAKSEQTRASALIIPEHLKRPDLPTVPLNEPWAGVLYLLNHFYPDDRFRHFEGVHPSAVVDPSARVAADAAVGANAVIGPNTQVGARTVIGPGCLIGPESVIGMDCVLHPGVTVAHQIRIGNRVIIQSGAVIGGDGFKYEVLDGRWKKIPQIGTVVIEDDVEIGANSCIDRASFTETRIGANTKIDNLVQIGHNVQLGSNCIIVSQSGIAGSCEVGEGTILAAQAGISDNRKIGRNVRILGQTGVKDDLSDGEVVMGSPARPLKQFARILSSERRLPEMISEVSRLRARIDDLEKKIKAEHPNKSE